MAPVNTVLGPVDSGELGVTLPHEHVFINLTAEFRAVGLLNDYDLMVEEVRAFGAAGGGALVDVTTRGLTAGAAPDPHAALTDTDGGRSARSSVAALRHLAKETGTHVVAGTGFYRDPYLDREWFDRNSVDAIAEILVKDITEGFDGIGVRAGIIGEIGADKWYISAAEERSFRAAARAHTATGLAITTHAARWPVGLPQLDLLESEGVDPRRVVIGHCDRVSDSGYYEQILRSGAWAQFDTIRGTNPHDTELRVGCVHRLVEKGYLDQILVSHDVCRTEHLSAYGGNGYTYVPTTFAGLLAERGLTAGQLRTLLVENPRRMLTGEG